MFTACPHCQFLVAHDPHSGAAPADCLRCGKPLSTVGEAPATAPSLATLLHIAPHSAQAAPVEPQAVEHETVDSSSVAPAETQATEAPTDTALEQTAIQEDLDAPIADSVRDDVLPASDSPSSDTATATIIEAPRPPASKPTGPRFLHHARTTPVHTRRVRLQWAAVLTLALLLCVQVVVADRARLATQAGWRPIVTMLCGAFRCDVPTWREPTAFTMLSRDVRPLLDAPGTLQAQATFRNEARWAQAWPVILLTLKDADGRTLGARALQPGDYLPAGETATAIGPGQSAQMAVRIREPSASVVAFSFDFR